MKALLCFLLGHDWDYACEDLMRECRVCGKANKRKMLGGNVYWQELGSGGWRDW